VRVLGGCATMDELSFEQRIVLFLLRITVAGTISATLLPVQHRLKILNSH
jgi:hypothetical protein